MCRVTRGHLRVTIGHLRVTVGHPRVTVGLLRLRGHSHITSALFGVSGHPWWCCKQWSAFALTLGTYKLMT